LGALGYAAMVCVTARFAHAQNSQFFFDPTGNLQAQASETSELPQIIGQPQMQVVIPGNNASFSVGVADTLGVTYQWYFNSTAIPGATADSLLITNASSGNEGPYWVAVSNAIGSVASVLANLYIDSRGCGMPDSWQLQYFGNLNQQATGDYDGDGVDNLQEFLDGTNPTNAASALYRITLVSDGGTVMISPDQPTYTNGQTVMLTATSTNTNSFHAWTGNVTTRSNSITVTMTNDLTLFAHFLPFTLLWTNLANGDWNGASNWSPNLIPGNGESVLIQNQTTVTENSNVDVVDFTLGNSIFTAGLAGTGTVTIAGVGTWNNGTMSGGGTTVVKPGASLVIVNSVNSSALGLTDRILENEGSIVWGGGNFSLTGVITNDPGGQFQLAAPATIRYGGGTARFDNVGSVIIVGNAATTFGVAFNNYGAVDFPSGTLTLSDGGFQGGTIPVPAGALLNLAGGTFTSSSNLSITGSGTLMVGGGSGATLGGTINVTGSNIFSSGGTELNGNYVCTNNVLTISGGSVNFDGTGLVSPSVISLSSGTLGGSNLVTASSAMSWTGGAMTGTGRTFIPQGVTLTISNSISITSRTLDNGGVTTWTGAGAIDMNGGVITNEPGALFQVQNPASISFGGGSPRFDNAGTFIITGSGTMTLGGAALNNFNTVEIQGGTLLLQDGGNNTGSISVPGGTAINFGGGTFNSSSGSSIIGGGSLLVSGGTETLSGVINLAGSNIFSAGGTELNGAYTCTNNSLAISGGTVNFDGTGLVSPSVISLSSGTLGGSNLVTASSAMSWTGGAMSGTGRTFIPPGVTLTISNAPISITSRRLDNAGIVTWPGANFLNMNGGVITNRVGALFNPQNASAIEFGGGSPRFDNAGTFRKTVSAGTLTFATVSFTNYGTVDIQTGVLYANGGGYASSSNAVLNCAIGGTVPETNYGQLQVAGSVTLDGTLSVNLTNNYIPTTNDSFIVLIAGTRNGTFANFIYPSNAVTMQLSSTATSVILSVNNVLVVPQPLLLPLLLSGSNVTLTWTAVSNTTYRAEFNPDLNPSNWNALSGDVTAVTNMASKLDILTPSNRFYRIQVIP
jgi:hypothetical protein